MYSIRQISFREIDFPGYLLNIIALKKTTYTVQYIIVLLLLL